MTQDPDLANSPSQPTAPGFVQALVAITGKHFDRALIIVLENQNYSSVTEDPFLAQLAGEGASFSNFRALTMTIQSDLLSVVLRDSVSMSKQP
jgi:hypothetical protein